MANSSFAVDQTRTVIMASWRRAVELAMTDEVIGKLTEISRSRTERRHSDEEVTSPSIAPEYFRDGTKRRESSLAGRGGLRPAHNTLGRRKSTPLGGCFNV